MNLTYRPIVILFLGAVSESLASRGLPTTFVLMYPPDKDVLLQQDAYLFDLRELPPAFQEYYPIITGVESNVLAVPAEFVEVIY